MTGILENPKSHGESIAQTPTVNSTQRKVTQAIVTRSRVTSQNYFRKPSIAC